MGLDQNSVGYESEAFEFEYDWKSVVLYALGIGATSDELDYLYEGRGPRVYPTFAVVPAYEPIQALIQKVGLNTASMVHGAQTVTVSAPLPPSGRLTTRARVAGIYDMKRMSQVVLTTRTQNGDTVVCETEWSLLGLSDGGFGGPSPPRGTRLSIPDGAAPLWQFEQSISNEQALLYRLSGDHNPLHADPDFAAQAGFPQGPILHGLCTFGFLARAVTRCACGGDSFRLRTLGAQFRRPTWPGDNLRVEGYRLGEDKTAIRAFSGARGEPVVGACWAQTSG